MIEVRIRRNFSAGPDSAGFALDVAFQTSSGITVLFGPSGAGKTQTLEAIAGFSKPDSGRILLDDAILFDAGAGVNLPPRLRNCGYVFQNYALFPHMTLRENLQFAAVRQPRLERYRRVNEMLERFHLAEASGRRPHQVSGGEKQRCSIARALIGSPKVLLLDVPARGLDAPLRNELYTVLRQVRSEFGVPILLVTHDLEECFELADEMLILLNGRVVQHGAPRQVIDQPANVDVARLLGIANLFPARIEALDPGRNTSRLHVREDAEAFELTGPYFPGHLLGDSLWVCVRAEDLRATAQNGSKAAPPQLIPNRVPARLLRVSEKPQTVRLEFAGGIFVELSREEFHRERESHERDNKDWVIEFPPRAVRVLRYAAEEL
jgi:molybdate transport system ATP-binding protein